MAGGLMIYIGVFILSLAVLLKASDWFVESAEEIGLSFGISPFIIGVTIIAFGTSLPELACSIAAVLEGDPAIVIGNAVGSNITNILLVLSLTAILGKEIILDYDVMDVDMPLLIASAFMVWFMVLDGNLSAFEAILLLCGLVVFLINSLRSGRSDDDNSKNEVSWKTYSMLLIGGVLVYYGAEYVIYAIRGLSTELSIESGAIAQTAVALGTSLPEVVVSIAAARKGKTAMAVGNVLGSNVFNTFAVLGIPALISPLVISAEDLSFSIPFMVAMTLIFGLVTLSKRISKWEGAMLLILYIFFLKQIISTMI